MHQLTRRRPHRTLRQRASLVLLAALLVVTTGTACVRRGARTEGMAAEEGADQPIPLPQYVFVDVQNRNSSDVTVHLIQGNGQALRIGYVPGSTNATLRFPGQLITGGSSLRLTARTVGGSEFVSSDRFTVQPGQQVVWSLESALRRSSVAVY